MALQEVNSNEARLLELADRLDQVQRNAQDSPLYQLPPFPTDDRVPLAQSAEVVSSQATSGATKVVLRWMRPADPNVDHFEIWVQRTAFQSENPYQIASVADAPAAFTINSDQDTAAVMYIRTIMKNGLSTDLKASPTVAVNVYKFVATATDIADGAVQNNHFDRVTVNKIVIVNADIANLAVDNAKIANATITFGKIATLAVGGAGLGAPGIFTVYNAANAAVAWAGTLGGYYGMWAANFWAGGTSPADAPFYIDGSLHANMFIKDGSNNIVAWAGTLSGNSGIWGKNLWAGGTGPATAPFYVDAVGNVVIDNTGLATKATFTLILNGKKTQITNLLSFGNYAGVMVSDTTSPNQRSLLGDTFLFMLNAADKAVMQITAGTSGVSEPAVLVVAHTTSAFAGMTPGLVSVGNSAGTTIVELSATAGINVSGNTVIATTRIADFVSLKVGGTEIVDSSRNANFASLKTGGTTRIDGSGNATLANIYTKTEVDTLLTGYSVVGHSHTTSSDGNHDHGGAVPQDGAHTHSAT